MTAKILNMRPKRHDTITQALQLALELPLGLSDLTRDEIAEALGRYEPAATWTFIMISPEQFRGVLKRINASPKPGLTLRVWTVLITHVRMETGEIMASLARIAGDAETTKAEASRAMATLTDMGALIRLRPGRYCVNPHVGWAGSLAKRETAAQGAPRLRLVEST